MAGEEVDQCHLLHAVHVHQGSVEFVQHHRGQGWGIDVDVGRNHLHRIKIEVARPKQREDFLSDTDTVDKVDVDSHKDSLLGKKTTGGQRSAPSPLGKT
ncbi:hypothetical protein D3C75_888500 [compost metagenome]